MFSKNLFPLTALFFALVILLPFDARGQETRATLLGTVADQTGAVIKGATVTATAEATGLRQSAITDGNGQYRIPLLPVGAYALAVEAMSFDPAEQRGLTLQVGEKRRVDVILNVGQLGANITIEAPITDSAANTLATIVPQERVANLPLNGRQLQELALTAPGVAAAGGFRSNAFNQFGLATSNDGNAGAFSVNGAPSRANGFFLDGVDINVPEQGVIAYVAIRSAIHRHRRLFRSRHGDCQPPTESGERSACERSRRIRLQPGSLRRAPPGQLGSLGRNTLRGDKYINTDFAIQRRFPLSPPGEDGNLQFRAEFFNIYNTMNLNFPVSALSSNAFGRFVNNATPPRVIQFAVKIGF